MIGVVVPIAEERVLQLGEEAALALAQELAERRILGATFREVVPSRGFPGVREYRFTA